MAMSNKRRLMSYVLILFVTLSPGCWDHTEIQNLAVVRAMGVDYLPGRDAPYLVTMAVKRPAGIGAEGGGGDSEPTELFTGVGATIDLAVQQASYSIASRVFLAHTEVFIVGEEMARQGVGHVADFIVRNVEARLNAHFIVADGLAHDFLGISERLESSISEEILGLIEQAEETSESSPQELMRFLRQMATPGQDAHAALLTKGPGLSNILPELQQGEQGQGGGNGGEGDGGEEGGQDGSGGGGSGGGGNEEVLILAGVAVFRGDRLAALLNPVETRGVLWLRGEINRGTIAVKDPVHPEESLSLLISRSQTRITPVVRDGMFYFRVEVEVEGDILSQVSRADLATPENLKTINSAKAGLIKEEMEKALQRLQELETDIIGFGTLLNRRHHRVYREIADRWPQEFGQLKVEIHVEANIRRTGQHSAPVRVNR
jgi:spore germination protein KC